MSRSPPPTTGRAGWAVLFSLSVYCSKSFVISFPSPQSQTKSFEHSQLFLFEDSFQKKMKVNLVPVIHTIAKNTPFVNISNYGVTKEDNFFVSEQILNFYVLKLRRHLSRLASLKCWFSFQRTLETIQNTLRQQLFRHLEHFETTLNSCFQIQKLQTTLYNCLHIYLTPTMLILQIT